MNDPRQEPQNVDSDQVATQAVTPTSTQVPAANETTDAGTPIHDGLQEPKDPAAEDDEQPVASHNVFDQNKADAGESNTDNVYPVDADNQASIDAALKKHHEAHGA